MFFENTKQSNNIPILLIDNSGSTSTTLLKSVISKSVISKSVSSKSVSSKLSDSESDNESEPDSVCDLNNENIIQQNQTEREKAISLLNPDNINLSILNGEVRLAKKYFESINIDKVYVMMWNSTAKCLSKEPINVSDLLTYTYNSTGGTYITPALNEIPESWIKQNNETTNESTNEPTNEPTDIYVYTDGEISDGDRFASALKELMAKSNINFHIVTVEANEINYLKRDCNAGNAIYSAIHNNKLMNIVKEFVSYNKHHIDSPFISFSNPTVGPDQVPFRGKCFAINQLSNFIGHIEQLIAEATVSTNVSATQSNEHILKLAHDLTITMYHLLKNKSLPIQKYTINLFSDLFADQPQETYKEVRKLFMEEINNHSKGQSTTFQAYRNNREKKFEQAQIMLFENVKKAISYKPSENYVSLLVNAFDQTTPSQNTTNEPNKYIIKTSTTNMTQRIVLSDKVYNNAGINIDGHTIPLIPTNIELDHDMFDQCLRQWVRANYGKKYSLNPASDFIQYYALADVLKVLVSDVSEETKIAYKSLAKVLLDRKRFGTDTTEYVYLLTNPPASVTNLSEDKINYIFTKSIEHANITNTSPMTFWYAFLQAYGDERLLLAQKTYCEEDMAKDGVNESTLLTHIKQNTCLVTEYVDFTNFTSTNTYDYTCYLTLDDLSDVGGYCIPAHKIGSKTTCNPKFMLSSESYQSINNISSAVSCPICQQQLSLSEFKFIKSKTLLMEELMQLTSQIVPLLNEPVYRVTNCENINIPKELYAKESDSDFVLKKMNECNFETNAFTINVPYVQEAIGSRTIEIKTQEEFNKSAFYRYPFLSKLNFAQHNVCLSGGFCRSILLRQKLKDFDFFFTGPNPETDFVNFLKQTMEAIKEVESEKLANSANLDNSTNSNIKFLIMYKHLFNVFEVVCVTDPNNFFQENYTLDNFKQYDFKSLHKFDKFTIIDPTTGKVYKKKNKHSNPIEINMKQFTQLVTEQQNESVKDLVKESVKELDNESVDDESVDNESVDNESVDNESVDDESVKELDNESENESVENEDEDSVNKPKQTSQKQTQSCPVENIDFSNYFEDGDVTGVRMKYRLQFILVKNNGIANVFKSFDMYPCRVAWDGQTTWFTDKSEFAYKYMVNIINENNYSPLFNHRLSKYFTYGFSIVMPEIDIEKINQRNLLKFSDDLMFNINYINGNQILVEHNSHVANKLDSIVKLEKRSQADGKVLYKSALFCSLVSLLRYVKINDVSYKFTSNIVVPNIEQNFMMEFREKTEQIQFIDKINTRIDNYDWYGFYKIEK